MKTYNNIWLKGSGRGKSILENWDVDVSRETHYGVISFGQAASINPPDRRLKNITISGLTIRQVLNATWGVKCLSENQCWMDEGLNPSGRRAWRAVKISGQMT
jgi:hypothetical protein